ncbi:hypothetical protein A6R68_22961 [Neotoma lepida]|uniref:Protein FAM33A n=1 Tax=Neotoma lepida TaxID=56216 RepID=A0A1A6HZ84_NEOLE|nr:hypothetical protein A6R68_22961 [Neotoma lepida]
MEAEVDKLELMKNAVAILKELSAIKSRYQALCARFKPLSVEQKENKSHICATLSKTMTMIQELQKQTDLEQKQLKQQERSSGWDVGPVVSPKCEADLVARLQS